MKILQLCKKFPYPLNDGESIAVSTMSRALNDLGCKVSLLSMNTSKHFFDLEQLPKSYNHYEQINTTPLDNKITIKGAISNLFSKDSYHVSRFVCSDYEAALEGMLAKESYDVIILETLYLTPYIKSIRKSSKALICYRSHNIESEIWSRIAKNSSSFPMRLYLSHLTKKLRQYEITHLNDYDLMATVSPRDLDKFIKMGYQGPGFASPIGLDLSKYPIPPISGADDLSFIGSLDWMPNSEGILWFVKEVLPVITTEYPETKLHIAGRNGSKEISDLNSTQITIHGEVPSAIEFISNYDIMIVPLLSGSGMRVKILEGLALGRIIITTTLGVEGIPAKHGTHLFIADTAGQFLECLVQIKTNSDLRLQMSKAARNFVSAHYDAKSNAQILLDKINNELKAKRS